MRAGTVPAADVLLVLRLLLDVDARHFRLGRGFGGPSEQSSSGTGQCRCQAYLPVAG